MAASTPGPTGPHAGRGISGTVLKVLATLVGLALLTYMIRAAGPAKLLEYILRLGPWWLLVLLVSATWFLMNTWGWRLTFAPRRPGFGRLLRIHLVAEAVSNITPFLAMGGEPLKLLLLQDLGRPGEVLASVVNDNVVHFMTAVAYMLLGLLAGLLLFRIDPALVAVLFGAIVLVALASGALLLRGRRGLLAPLARFWTRHRPGRADGAGAGKPDLLARAEAVDQRIEEFLTHRRLDFLGCFAGHLGGRFMGAVEAWVIMWALGTPISLGTAVFLIAVMHVLVNLVFSVIPSQLGFQEGAAYLLFQSIGLDPAAAVALALIRRIRSFFWIGLGLILLGLIRSGKSRPTSA